MALGIFSIQTNITNSQSLPEPVDPNANIFDYSGLEPLPPSNVYLPATQPTQTWQNTGKTYKLLEPLPCLDSRMPDCKGGQIENIDLGNFFQYAFNLLIALSAVAAVFMIVWGGFQYMTTDSSPGKSEGKEKFKNAIYGLLMVIGSFLILKTVNPKLVQIPASIPPVRVDSSQTQSPLSFFDQINRKAEEYNTNLSNIQNDLMQAQTKLNGLYQQKTDLQNLLNGPYDTELAATYEVQLEQINSQIEQQEAIIIGTGTNEMMTQKAMQIINADSAKRNFLGDPATPREIQNNITEIDNIKTDALIELEKYGQSDIVEKQKQAVIDQANYKKADIEITTSINAINQISETWKTTDTGKLLSPMPAWTKNEAETALNNALILKGQMQDPVLQSKLQTQIKDLNTLLNERLYGKPSS
ncbi:MAG: pilin [Candidatus Paceibacterota bacterium]